MSSSKTFRLKNKSGDWSKTMQYLKSAVHTTKSLDIKTVKSIAESEVAVFANATPTKTGKTAASWYCTVEKDTHGYKICYCNSNIQNGVNVAIMVDVGHSTPTGQWYGGAHYLDKTTEKVKDDLLNKFMEALNEHE